VTTCVGTVTAVEPGPGDGGIVRLDVAARDQRGEITAKGWAKVRLPRRK